MSLPKIKRLIKGNYAITPEEIQEEYLQWLSIDEYLIFEYQKFRSQRRFVASLCPKRGNKKYASRVKNKFKELILPYEYEKKLKVAEEAKQQDLDNKFASEKYTQTLSVTLTYDTKLTDLFTAWQTIGRDWNKFLSNIKKKKNFGSVYVVRCFESSENNYPHIHAIIYFEHQNFQTWHRYENGKSVWRVPYENHEIMAQYWHSFIDVEGMPYLGDGLNYLLKYITKCSDFSAKALKTLSLTWAFGKRAFSIGHKFKQEIFKLYLAYDLTPNILIQTTPSQQTLDEKQVKSSLLQYLKTPSIKPQTLGNSNSSALKYVLEYEKWQMKGIIGKKTLKVLGGIPKGDWSFGLNSQQYDYALGVFYKIKPEKQLDDSEERKKMIKNPFAQPNGVNDAESGKIVHNAMNQRKRVPESPILGDCVERWWETEGQFQCQ